MLTLPPGLSIRQQSGLSTIKYSTASYIIGVDEVGLGAWAGPLCVGAVAMPRDWQNPLVKDSKKMSASARNAAVPIIRKDAAAMSVLFAPAEQIDRDGVAVTLHRLVFDVVNACLAVTPDAFIVLDGDGNESFGDVPHVTFPKADALVPAVSAASVLAKVARDGLMQELGRTRYRGYGFERHVGYGTPQHIEAINRLGICPLHRRSYAPIKRIVENDIG